MRPRRLFGWIVLVVGLALLLESVGALPAMAVAQPALPSSISGDSVIQLPPCNGQTTNDCVLPQGWSAALLSPDQAAAVYVALGEESGSFNTCGLIAFYQSTLTSPSLLPGNLSAESTVFYGGYQLVSPALPGYPGTGSTPYVHYSTADGCGTYGSVTSSTSATPSASPTPTSTMASSSSSSTTASTTSTSSSITAQSMPPSPYGGRSPVDFPEALLGSLMTLGGVFLAAGGRLR